MRHRFAALLSIFLVGCGGSDAGIFEEKGDGGDESSTTDETSTSDSSSPEDSTTPPPGDDGPPPVDSTTEPDTAKPSLDTGVAIDTAPPVTCTEPGGKMYEGHCYFPTMPRNWTNSRDTCTMYKAHLVTITSAAEQAFVSGILSGERWIGLYRPEGPTPAPSAYKWQNGEAVGYTNWELGEPNFSGSCVRLLVGGTWADQACSQSYNAICERE